MPDELIAHRMERAMRLGVTDPIPGFIEAVKTYNVLAAREGWDLIAMPKELDGGRDYLRADVSREVEDHADRRLGPESDA